MPLLPRGIFEQRNVQSRHPRHHGSLLRTYEHIILRARHSVWIRAKLHQKSFYTVLYTYIPPTGDLKGTFDKLGWGCTADDRIV